MKGGGFFVDSALIVSSTEKSISYFADILKAVPYSNIVSMQTCGEARRLLIERDFNLCIINAPLSDELGKTLSLNIAAKGICQVVLVVKSEIYDEISHAVEDLGVITISKPINRNILWSALKLARAAQKRMEVIQNENNKLIQKIDDIRIVNRAKYILMSYLSMTEPEAHKYIEKQAMDMRVTKRNVAEGILKTYEN